MTTQNPSLQTPLQRAIAESETILLVEDFRPLRKVICHNLQKIGYRVISAANGMEALHVAALHKGPIHLLLTDIIMPGMDGPELAKRLAKLRPGVGVLYMSGRADKTLNKHEAPKVASVRKPFEMSALVAKIREEMERQTDTGAYVNSKGRW